MGESREFMAKNIGDIISPDKDQDKIALIDCSGSKGPRHFTFRQLDGLICACANGLSNLGLKRGDAVAVISMNRAEFLISHLAIMRAGMISVPINHKLSPETLNAVFDDAEVKFAFSDEGNRSLVPPHLPAACFDDSGWTDLLAHGPFATVLPEPDDCAMILFTSGSTGRPKGVQLTHGGQIWSIAVRINSIFSSDRLIVAAPMFHMNALTFCTFALAGHASLVLMPHFDAKSFISAIGDYGVTWITSVPTMMALVLRETAALAEIERGQVRNVRMGSAPATAQLYDSVRAAFPNATVAGGYGTTEAGAITFGPTLGRVLSPHGGLGWPMPDVEVRLATPDGTDQDDTDPDEGELWMRTPAVMLGYKSLPEKTAEVLTPDRWYRSRDRFRRDSEGCYHFIGRIDDMFNCGGENIYPGEVEKVIERMPGVLEACVVPVTDELKGQKPVAFIVLKEGAQLDAAHIKSFALANAPAYQHPRHVFFLQSFPLAATNKVDRAKLRVVAEDWINPSFDRTPLPSA